MKKSDKKTILWVGIVTAIILIFVYGGNAGWFKSVINQAPTTPPPNNVPNQFQSYNVFLSFNPNPACTGNSVMGTIDSNIPNGVCTLFQMLDGWEVYDTFNLNANGDVSASQVISVPGTAQLQAVCCDASGNCKVSNSVSLVVRNCSVPPEPEPEVSDDVYCDADCQSVGFASGRDNTPSCSGTEVAQYFGFDDVNCCCTPFGGDAPATGGDYGGYPSCTAFKTAEGKEFYSEGSGITSIDGCESFAQSYCSQFGSAEPHTFGGIPPGYVTVLDFATPDCCIFNCNWSWN